MKSLISVLGVLLMVSISTSNEYFSSTSSLVTLLQTERYILELLKDYVEGVDQHLDVIKKFINDRILVGEKNMEEYVSNPIHAYNLMKRMTVDLQAVEASTQVMASPEYVPSMHHIRSISPLPTDGDLQGAADALVRLLDTYKLNMSAMIRGIIRSSGRFPSFEAHEQLTARDCLFLGKHSFNQGLYDYAIDWFEAALTKANEEGNRTVSPEEIQLFLSIAISIHNEVPLEIDDKETTWKTVPVPFSDRNYMSYERNFKPVFFVDNLDPVIEKEQFNRLCRGEHLRPLEWDKDLKCRYFNGHHPYLLIQPIKLEEKSHKPYIVQLHDVISDQEIQRLKNISQVTLHRSSHYGISGEFEASLMRTSASSWLTKENDPVIVKLDHRVAMITGLATKYSNEEAEAYQFQGFEYRAGDRIATWMFYLSDVEAGGATAFTYAGTVVWPKKGSAAFWWNLKRNGEGDEMTRHGACPVLHGSKWVSNKWFRVNSQMFRKPCSLERDEYFAGL
ncbi:prolyl 4-hydroxylase subunit alpha-2-like isoform X3 [Tachypleus tridentatus]|uniref:prolyl 4-hydroxylase subunit alpha-2-like isoform X3 n=1 Tax=Tachypleus tridentatus TaxID=6853 RepID=UPI003FD3272D